MDELQQEDSMEYNGLKMLPPDKEYRATRLNGR